MNIEQITAEIDKGQWNFDQSKEKMGVLHKFLAGALLVFLVGTGSFLVSCSSPQAEKDGSAEAPVKSVLRLRDVR